MSWLFSSLGFVHIIIAIFFAIHAVRNGRQLFWLFILFSFPMLGSIVYFVVEYLPSSNINKGFSGAMSIASKALNPNAELKAAQDAVDLTPTVENKLRLAKAWMTKGAPENAIKLLESCLTGQFANDPTILFLTATAQFENKQAGTALNYLKQIRTHHPEFREEQVSLLLAKAQAATGNTEAAGTEFKQAASKFGSIETLADYAIYAASKGDLETAQKLRQDMAHSWKHWNAHVRSQHKEIFDRVDQALAKLNK